MTLHPGNKYLENRSGPYTHTVKEGIFVAVYPGCEHWMKLLKMKNKKTKNETTKKYVTGEGAR